MRSYKQLKKVLAVFNFEKQNLSAKLAKIHQTLALKYNQIQQINAYYNDYHQNEKFKLSRENPALNQNFQAFGMKIIDVVRKEEKEIQHYEEAAAHIVKNLQQLEQRIQAFATLISKADLEWLKANDKKTDQQLTELSQVLGKADSHE